MKVDRNLDAPLVSVLLPVFNCETYIGLAVESIVAQTYRNIEVIVVDDGSTDGTGQVLYEAAKTDDRIHVIRTENRGLIAALNTAIEAANGELAARMDADDVAEPERFAQQVAHMLARPNCVAVGTNTSVIDANGNLAEQQPSTSDSIHLADRCRQFERFPPAPQNLVHPSAMIRMSALRKVGGYRSYFKNGAEDRDLWWRLGELGAIHCLPERLLRYRLHLTNRSETLKEEARADALISDLSALSRYLKLDDRHILEEYGSNQNIAAAVTHYDALVGRRYPVWALHAYRTLRRRQSWRYLADASTRNAFKVRTFLRALSSLSSRPTWYVLGTLVR